MKASKVISFQSSSPLHTNEALEYPFFYQPKTIALEAAELLQAQLEERISTHLNASKGRMFGVLVVEDPSGNLGYLMAYSGEEQAELEHLPFVPPVYRLSKGKEFTEMAAINDISLEIERIKNSEGYQNTLAHGKQVEEEVTRFIAEKRTASKAAKKARKLEREVAQTWDPEKRKALEIALAEKSKDESYTLKRFIKAQNERLAQAQAQVEEAKQEVERLKTKRKQDSATLQQELFEAYIFLNAKGEQKNVREVFDAFKIDVPPAGAGECAAPKLFQYAFKHELKPIAMAEFWWGPSPDSEIRVQGQYYPACKSKCKPILSFMLEGLEVKSNPLLVNKGADKSIEIIFEDEDIALVNKPEGLLSVPGKSIEDSVESRIAKDYPKATGPLIVHRLDQDTSGIMIVAKTKESHEILQRQFLERSIHKKYVAILEKSISEPKGLIDLPLILDLDRRPMQKVDYSHGKRALSNYKVLEKNERYTLIQMSPITGRSHQLRVHCAHHLGLNAPIIGDNLYGTPEKRLYLHAQSIQFIHPTSGKKLTFKAPCPFNLQSVSSQ